MCKVSGLHLPGSVPTHRVPTLQTLRGWAFCPLQLLVCLVVCVSVCKYLIVCVSVCVYIYDCMCACKCVSMHLYVYMQWCV